MPTSFRFRTPDYELRAEGLGRRIAPTHWDGARLTELAGDDLVVGALPFDSADAARLFVPRSSQRTTRPCQDDTNTPQSGTDAIPASPSPTSPFAAPGTSPTGDSHGGAPSAGVPSTGAPSAGVPSTGLPSMGFHERGNFHDDVAHAVDAIARGDIDKVVLGRQVHGTCPRPIDADQLQDALWANNPNAFGYHLSLDATWLLGRTGNLDHSIALPADNHHPTHRVDQRRPLYAGRPQFDPPHTSPLLNTPITGYDHYDTPELNHIHPNAHHTSCDLAHLVGASPELVLKVQGRTVSTFPLAGSIPRAQDPEEDARRTAFLRTSAKNRAEHAHVTGDILRILDQLCTDVVCPPAPEVIATPVIWHLGTPIQAQLRPGVSSWDVLCALHPTPAVSGWPQRAARRFISSTESTPRGVFAGVVGWCDGGGDCEWAMTLRGGITHHRQVYAFAGAGIVAGSTPAEELVETSTKLRTFLDPLTSIATADAGGCATASSDFSPQFSAAAWGRTPTPRHAIPAR